MAIWLGFANISPQHAESETRQLTGTAFEEVKSIMSTGINATTKTNHTCINTHGLWVRYSNHTVIGREKRHRGLSTSMWPSLKSLSGRVLHYTRWADTSTNDSPRPRGTKKPPDETMQAH